jgi:hypothetical protein
MNEVFTVPRCPQCGEPPRAILTHRVVKEQIRVNRNGSIDRLGHKLGRTLPNAPSTVECGGGHKWASELVTEP